MANQNDKTVTITFTGDVTDLNKQIEDIKKQSKALGVAIKAGFSTVDTETGEATTKMSLLADSLKDAEKVFQRFLGIKDSRNISSIVRGVTSEVEKLKEALNKFQAGDRGVSRNAAASLAVQQAEREGNTIKAIKARLAQEELRIENTKAARLLQIEQDLLSKKYNLSAAQASRMGVYRKYETEVNAARDAAHKLIQIEEEKIRQLKQLTPPSQSVPKIPSIAPAIKEHKTLLGHIGEIIIGYRLINSAINAFLNMLKSVPQKGIEMQSNFAGLESIFGTKGAEQELTNVTNIADKWGANLEVLEKGYVKFAPAAKLAGLAQEKVNKIFEDFTVVGTALHKTPEEMSRVWLAIEQMLSKRKVMVQEIQNQMGDVLPAMMELGARADKESGGNSAIFRKRLEEGKIIAAQFLPEFSALIRKTFAGANDEVADKVAEMLLANTQRTQNAYTRLIREIFKRSEEAMTEVLKLVSPVLDGIRTHLDEILQIGGVVVTLIGVRLTQALAGAAAKTYALATANTALLASQKLAAAGMVGTTFVGPLANGTKVAGTWAEISAKIQGATIALMNFLRIPIPTAMFAGITAGVVGLIGHLRGLELKYKEHEGFLIKFKDEEAQLSDLITVAWEHAKKNASEALDHIILKVKEVDPVLIDVMGNLINSAKSWLSVLGTFTDSWAAKALSAVSGVAAGIMAANGAGEGNVPRTKAEAASRLTKWDAFKSAFSEEFDFSMQRIKEMTAQDDKDLQALFKEAQERNRKMLEEKSSQNIHPLNFDPSKPDAAIPDKKAAAVARAARQMEFKDFKDQAQEHVKEIQGILKEEELAYKNNQRSIATYYESKRTLEQAALDFQIDAAKKSLALARKEDPLKAKQYESDLRELQTKRNQVEGIVLQEKTKDLEAYNKLLLETHANYLKAMGLTEDAATAKLQAKNLEAVGRFSKEAELGDSRAKQALLEQKDIERMAVARAQIEGITDQEQLNRRVLNNRQFFIRTQEKLDAIGPVEALMKTQKAFDEYIKNQDLVIRKWEQVDMKGNAAMQQQLADAKAALETFRMESDVVAQHFQNIFTSSFDNAFSNFISGTRTASESFTDFVTSVAKDLAMLAAHEARSQLVQLLTAGIKGIAGAINFGGQTPGQNLAGGTSDVILSQSANGNVFSNGSITRFANGGIPDIGDKKAFFRTRDGRLNSLRESGPEAIVPLRRSGNGRLGIEASGLGGTSTTNIFNVTINQEVSKNESPEGMGTKAAEAFIRKIADERIFEANRRGNMLNKHTKVA
jgi:lambda family phage tail tape measure protein